MSEEDVTRAIVVKSAGQVGVKAYLAGDGPAPREPKSGADLEVWFYDRQNTSSGFGWRVQAKRIAPVPTGCLYRDVGRHIGGKATNERQIDRLIRSAANDGLAAWYWLYNTSIESCGCEMTHMACGSSMGCAHCGHMHHSFIENGLVALPAVEMRRVLDSSTSPNVDVAEAMAHSWHLRCILGSTTAPTLAGGGNSARSMDDLIRFLHRQPDLLGSTTNRFTGLPTSFVDDPGADEPPRRRLPEEVQLLLGRDAQPEALDAYTSDRGLVGLLAVEVG